MGAVIVTIVEVGLAMHQTIWQSSPEAANRHVTLLQTGISFATHCTTATQCASVKSFFASMQILLQTCYYHYSYPCCR